MTAKKKPGQKKKRMGGSGTDNPYGKKTKRGLSRGGGAAKR
jgi:hypothetical protein